jgi:hypothetical protein
VQKELHMKRITDPLSLARKAAAEYQACYSSDLISLILYGSAAGGEFDPNRSDINLLIVLKEMTLDLLAKSASIQDKWIKQRFARPLFMDKAYIATSLDSFPMEFLSMKNCHTVLAGEDALSEINIDKSNLRLQLEREIKGKQLHLMQEWLIHRKHNAIGHLLSVSLRDFATIFSAFLFFKGIAVPAAKKDLFTAMDTICGFSEKPLARTYEALRSEDKKRMFGIFQSYNDAIRKLSGIIDKE